jgi:hypothetical protein
MTNQPEALRLADALEYASNNWHSVNHQAVAELRRLHAEVESLRAALKQIASCTSHHKGDVVDIARAALKEKQT